MKALGSLAATALAVACASPALAGQAAPFTPQDLVTLGRLGGVALAPDGRQATVAVTRTDPTTLKRTSDLHMLQLDRRGPPAMLNWSGASDPAYGPDGSLYFLATSPPGLPAADGATTQVWRIPARPEKPGMTGQAQSAHQPEYQQVTSFGTDVAGFRLSPDGTRIAVWGDIARTCPTFGCESDGNTALPGPGSGRHYTDGAGFVRHWDAWETPGNYSRVFAFAIGPDGKVSGEGQAADGPVGTLTGDSPTKPFGGGEEIAWAADSRSLFFVARQADRDEPTSTNLDIWQSRLDGNAPVNLTAANRATDTLPAASPDGKWLAYAAMARPGYESDRLVVTLIDLKTGERRALTTDWDRSVASLVWTPDSAALIATAADVLDTPAFRIDRASGKVTRLTLNPGREGHIGAVIPMKDGRLLYTRDSIDAPAELMIAKPGKAGTALTDISASVLAQRAPVAVRRFRFAGAGGDTVWGQIVKPDGANGKLPTVLLVHGGPQGSFNDGWSNRWNPRVWASRGYAVVTIDFHGSTGYGQAFTDAINRDWGGKPLVDLQQGMAAAAALDSQVDPANACAAGASYGGYMMNWIAGNWPGGFKCLVQHDGVFDARAMAYETEELWFDEWEHGGQPYYAAPGEFEKWNPVNHVAQWQTPMLVITGEKDFRIPYTQGLAAFTALQRRGVPSELLVFPDENHWVLKPRNSLQWHETVFAWIDRWLNGKDGK
ncbi:Dipeptidyl aminopeptidase/acylaminoacyl peptidase [Novosphingobium lubricantis]|jgi:dipeptidyl aminopeptidase/acylaminoacyl peptidase